MHFPNDYCEKYEGRRYTSFFILLRSNQESCTLTDELKQKKYTMHETNQETRQHRQFIIY